MEIFALSRDLEVQGILQNFSQLEWIRKLNEPGTFTVVFPYTTEAAGYLTQGAVLYNTDHKEPGIVTRVSKEITDKGAETLTVKGYMAGRYLWQRIVSKREILTGTPQEIMKTLTVSHAISPEDEKRAIPRLYMGTDTATITEAIEYQTEYIKLSQALTNIAAAYELGWGLSASLPEKKYYLDIWSGKDKTITSETPCLISTDFGSAYSQRYYEDISNYATYCMTGSGNDDERITAAVGGGEGLDRFEMYATANGISKKGLSENEIKEQLQTSGAEKLAKYPKTMGFTAKVNINSGMTFDLGDYVTCENRRWGVRENMQVKAIKQTIKAGRSEVAVTFGDEIPTLTSLIKAKG